MLWLRKKMGKKKPQFKVISLKSVVWFLFTGNSVLLTTQDNIERRLLLSLMLLQKRHLKTL
jgi:hypothetical protein